MTFDPKEARRAQEERRRPSQIPGIYDRYAHVVARWRQAEADLTAAIERVEELEVFMRHILTRGEKRQQAGQIPLWDAFALAYQDVRERASTLLSPKEQT